MKTLKCIEFISFEHIFVCDKSTLFSCVYLELKVKHEVTSKVTVDK